MKIRVFSLLLAIIISVTFASCMENGIEKPDTSTKTVIQNSEYDYVTFTLDVPESWNVLPLYGTSVICLADEKDYELIASPYSVKIENCIYPHFPFIDENVQKAHKDLFNGDRSGIEKIINNDIEYINASIVVSQSPEKYNLFDSPDGVLGYFDILADGTSTADTLMPPGWEDKVWASDFVYNEYNGQNGKIIAVEYNYIIEDKTYKGINCYRDDYYSVCGVYSGNDELSSGDIALWIADNMQVKEHFKFEDNQLKLEGKDY